MAACNGNNGTASGESCCVFNCSGALKVDGSTYSKNSLLLHVAACDGKNGIACGESSRVFSLHTQRLVPKERVKTSAGISCFLPFLVDLRLNRGRRTITAFGHVWMYQHTPLDLLSCKCQKSPKPAKSRVVCLFCSIN